jgi:thiamine transport system ATP-binding protein
VVMDRGRVVQAGTPSEVWTRPASERVARFLGFANVMPASAVGAPGGGMVLVRPQAITLERPGFGAATDRGDLATVTAVIYRGDHVEVTVQRADDGLALETSVRPDDDPWRVGDTAVVTIDRTGVQSL